MSSHHLAQRPGSAGVPSRPSPVVAAPSAAPVAGFVADPIDPLRAPASARPAARPVAAPTRPVGWAPTAWRAGRTGSSEE